VWGGFRQQIVVCKAGLSSGNPPSDLEIVKSHRNVLEMISRAAAHPSP
jgi:hypothetical protein